MPRHRNIAQTSHPKFLRSLSDYMYVKLSRHPNGRGVENRNLSIYQSRLGRS